MKDQPKQNLDYALAGRRDYKQLYSQAKDRLEKELKECLVKFLCFNTERRSHAQERLKHLDMLIAEQETLEKTLSLGNILLSKEIHIQTM